MFPAQRFIRIRPVQAPRPYHAANEGTIRRKDDLEFWLSMNRDFGVPWGPWGFGSGMGVEDVDRDEAEAAGVLKPGERVNSVAKDFNEGLAASIRDLDPAILAALRRTTGGTAAAGRLAPRQANNGGELNRAFPKPEKLSPETIGQSMRKLARHDGRPLVDKATIDIADPTVRRMVEDSLQNLGSMLPPSLTAKLNRARIVIAADTELRGVAGSYNRRTGRMRLNARLAENPLELAATVVHETGHWIWPQLSDSAHRRVRAHFAKRTRGETPFTRGGKRYFRDQWAHELAGLEGGEEVIPYHLEILALPPEAVAARLGDPYQRETLEIIMNLIGIIP